MKKEQIPSIIIAVVVLLVGQGLVIRYLNAPRLYFDELPSHHVGNLETHVYVLRNAGRAQLKALVLSAKCTVPITAFRFDGPNITEPESDALLLSGKRGERAIEIGVGRMLPKSAYSLTLQTPPNTQISFTGSSEETQAVPSGDTHLVEWASVLLGLLCTVLAVLSGIVTYRKGNLVTRNACKARRVRDGVFLKGVINKANESFQSMIEIFVKAMEPNADGEEVRAQLNSAKDVLIADIAALQGYADIISEEGICADGVSNLIATKREVEQDRRADVP